MLTDTKKLDQGLPEDRSSTLEFSKESKVVDARGDEEDAEERLARGRERNREHARRTRLRKKAQLQNLQAKMMELQSESRRLKQSIEECSIASILLGLSGGPKSGNENSTISKRERSLSECSSIISSEPISVPTSVKGRRKRFISDISGNEEQTTQFRFEIRGQSAVIGGGGSTHINWKTGVYCDENGEQKQLTNEELESLRRERNRMHAKMTRDRKKNFISCVEKTIAQLERENQKMRETLKLQVENEEITSSYSRAMNQTSVRSGSIDVSTAIESDSASQLQSIVASSVAKAMQNHKVKEMTNLATVGFDLVA